MKIFTKAILAFITASALCLESFAQTNIDVHVQSKDNGLPVEYVYVNVYHQNPERKVGTAVSDEKGIASIVVDSFPVIIEAVGVGYGMERITLHEVPAKAVEIKVSKTFSSLNEVVVTGVSRPTKPLDALSNYKIITAAQLQAQGAVNVQDAIGFQLNSFSSNDGVLGATVQMQGMAGNKVKILMDGVPVNGREGGNIDLGQLNTYNLERIEIVQGPMSIMYGTDALGGVINLISKKSQKKLGFTGEAYYETVGKYNFNGTLTKSFGKHHFSLGGGRNYFDGEISIDTSAPYRRQSFKPKEQYLGNFSYNFRPSENFNLQFASDFIGEKVVNKGTKTNKINHLVGLAWDEIYHNTRSVNRLTMDGKLGKQGHWQMINGYSYYHRKRNEYKRDLVNLTDTLTVDTLGEKMHDTTTFHEFSLRGMYDNIVWKKLNYTVGYDLNFQSGNSQKIPGGVRNLNDYAFFTTTTLPLLGDKLKVQAGFRASHNTAYKSPAIPSFNLLYKANATMSFRASYAKGFRAPSLKELYLDFVDNNHKIFGNPNLKAEVGEHIQASMSWMVFEKEANYAQVLVTGYYNNVFNQIGLAARYPNAPPNSTEAQYWDYTNTYRMKNMIATIELEGQYSNFHYKLGYSYANTFKQDGQYENFDAHEITTTLQYFWKWSKLNISLFNKLNGARPQLVSNIDGSATYDGRLPMFNLMDFSIGRKSWNQNMQITAGVKNIFDVNNIRGGTVVTSVHSSGGGLNFMPRSFFTSLRLNLD